MNVALRCLLLAALGAPAALAGVPTPPRPAPGPGFSLAPVARKTLPNGLRVLVWPRRTAPVVTTMLWYRVGSRDEQPGATGLAHFLEHLLFKGTERLKKGEIDRLTYQYAGTNNAFTFNDYTAYEFNFPREHWEVALRIEADRMRNCRFDAAEFEAERQVVMEERRGGQDDPSRRFGEQIGTALFTAHPYRNPVIGWMEDLKRVTRDEVYAFYRRHYTPGNATLVITGDVSAEEALRAAGKAFARVPALPAPPRRVVSEPERVPGQRRVDSVLPTQVPRVSISFPGPPRGHRDAAALALLDYTLSRGRLSRLHRRLVDGDAVSAETASSFGLYREAGELNVDADVSPTATPDRVEAALWEEIEELHAAPPPEREFERARNQFFADWVTGLETANDLANLLGEADATGGIERLERLWAGVRAATPEDVRRVAREYLRRDRAVIGRLLPQGAASVEPRPLSAEPRASRREWRVGRGWGARAGARTLEPGTRHRDLPTGNPEPGTRSPGFAALRPLERRLPNGMRLLLLENRDVPAVQFSLRLDAGAHRDPPDRPGAAAFTARLLDQGAGGRDHEAISEALEQVGAVFDTETARETTRVDLRCLSAHAGALLPLYAALITAPEFPAVRAARERARWLVELAAEEDDAGVVAGRALRALVFGDHPAGRPVDGTAETAARLTRDDAMRFHRAYYRPENATLAVVGDFRAADLLPRLEAAFGRWERGTPQAPVPPPPARQQEARERRIPLDKTQTRILLGHLGVRRADPDFLPLLVMDTILGEGVGGGFTARIPYQLRDVEGLAYSVSSSITSTAGREPGLFVAVIGTAPEKEAAAVAGLRREIRRLRAAGVTATELREAVAYLGGSYVFSFQTHAQFADYLLAVTYYDLGFDYRREFTTALGRVTREDVLRVARKHLDPDRASLVVVGPAAPPRP